LLHPETCDCERICRADHIGLQAFVIAESVSDVSKRRNCVAHLSVHDGVQCVRRAELLKVGVSQRGSAIFNGIFNGSSKARSMLTLMSIEHELLCSLDFTDTIEEFALAKARITAIGL